MIASSSARSASSSSPVRRSAAPSRRKASALPGEAARISRACAAASARHPRAAAAPPGGAPRSPCRSLRSPSRAQPRGAVSGRQARPFFACRPNMLDSWTCSADGRGGTRFGFRSSARCRGAKLAAAAALLLAAGAIYCFAYTLFQGGLENPLVGLAWATANLLPWLAAFEIAKRQCPPPGGAARRDRGRRDGALPAARDRLRPRRSAGSRVRRGLSAPPPGAGRGAAPVPPGPRAGIAGKASPAHRRALPTLCPSNCP